MSLINTRKKDDIIPYDYTHAVSELKSIIDSDNKSFKDYKNTKEALPLVNSLFRYIHIMNKIGIQPGIIKEESGIMWGKCLEYIPLLVDVYYNLTEFKEDKMIRIFVHLLRMSGYENEHNFHTLTMKIQAISSFYNMTSRFHKKTTKEVELFRILSMFEVAMSIHQKRYHL